MYTSTEWILKEDPSIIYPSNIMLKSNQQLYPDISSNVSQLKKNTKLKKSSRWRFMCWDRDCETYLQVQIQFDIKENSSTGIFQPYKSFLLFLSKPFLDQSKHLKWTYHRYCGIKFLHTFLFTKKKKSLSTIRSISDIRQNHYPTWPYKMAV